MMVSADYVRVLFDYNYWAWDRVLARAKLLSPEEYERDVGFTYGGLRGILVHALWAEAVWRARWMGEAPVAPFTAADLPAFADLVSAWGREESSMRRFLGGLTDERVAQPLEYRSTRTGMTYNEPLWQQMAHVANHGTQHRSEAAEVLTMLGRSPGDLDMLDFFRTGRG